MEKVTVNAELLLELNSKSDWIRKCPQQLPKRRSRSEHWIWIDKNGNALEIGEDFAAAADQDAYPVKIYKLIRTSEAK